MKKQVKLPPRRYEVRTCGDGVKRGGFAAKTFDEYCHDFWARVDKSNDDGCWIWRGATRLMGNKKAGRYGIATWFYSKRATNAHRIAYMLENNMKSIPKGFEILHLCNDGLCQRTSHLKMDTHAANMAQAAQDGLMPKGANSSSVRYKYRRPRGEKHPHAKLAENDVREMFRLRNIERRTIKDINKKFGVSDASQILRGKVWAHIGAEFQIDPAVAREIHRANNGAAHRKFTDDDVRMARKLFAEGDKVAKIVRVLGHSYSQTRKVVLNEIYQDVK